MAEKKKRVMDKWKSKSWYSVIAPETFDSKEIGQIVSGDEANLANRVIKMGLGDLTGSFSQGTAYTSVFFRVADVRGKSAITKFIGHELVAGYVRTLARRRRSVVSQVDDVKSKDGVPIRIKSLCITGLRVSESVRCDLRKAMSESVKQIAAETDFNQLVQEMIFGKFSAKIYNSVKKIGPIKRVEIRKSEVIEEFS